MRRMAFRQTEMEARIELYDGLRLHVSSPLV